MTENIRTFGIVYTDDCLRFDHVCSGFEFDLVGKTARAEFVCEYESDIYAPHIRIYADGQEKKVKLDGKTVSLMLCEFEEEKRHRVQVVNLSEMKRVSVGLKSLDCDGQILLPNKVKRPVIEFVGDSITCGFGNIGTLSLPYSTMFSDGEKTYAALTASSLGVDYYTYAISGIACSMYSEEKLDMKNIHKRYGMVQPYRSELKREFKPIPELVVINLGTNDGGADDTDLKDGIVKLVDMIRERYGDVPMVWCYGMMSHIKAAVIENTVKELADNGYNISYADLPEMDRRNDGAGCAYHPNVVQHEKAAAVLTEYLKEHFGSTVLKIN